MSNPLFVRRVRVRDIDAAGNPVGGPYYGIIASDNLATAVDLSHATRESLEEAIAGAPSIFGAIDDDRVFNFDEPNHEVIGRDNFYGKDWEGSPDNDDDVFAKVDR